MKRSGQIRNTAGIERRRTERVLDIESAALLFRALGFAAHKHPAVLPMLSGKRAHNIFKMHIAILQVKCRLQVFLPKV